jgi:prepilin-type N-terminal cleavage/methylation domain-containing protein
MLSSPRRRLDGPRHFAPRSGRTPAARHHAFTLIELLVVISIIGLLVSILLPALSQARILARKVQCSSNLKQMGVGLYGYASDYDGQFPFPSKDQNLHTHWTTDRIPAGAPFGTGHGALWPDYISEQKIYWSPSNQLMIQRHSGQVTNDYNAGLGSLFSGSYNYTARWYYFGATCPWRDYPDGLDCNRRNRSLPYLMVDRADGRTPECTWEGCHVHIENSKLTGAHILRFGGSVFWKQRAELKRFYVRADPWPYSTNRSGADWEFW